MQWDFDKLTERRGTNSLKWDVAEGELPMWVADMDFETAPAIVEAIQKKAATGIFGYTTVPEAYYDAVRGWWRARHGFEMEREWILFCTGVVPAISAIVRKMTTVGENVLVQSPVYNIFYNSVTNNGRKIVSSDLRYENGKYQVDFADLEERLANPQTTLMLLCNPHNPIGKIWDQATLAQIGELCLKHHVLVVSDEIHCDLTHPGLSYIPFASVSPVCAQNSITCIAPTKAFNLAGLQTASVVIPNEVIRHKVNRGLNTDEVAEPSAFAMEATITAFTKGAPWLEELRSYIHANKEYVREYITRELPQLYVLASESTYLLWIDCRSVEYQTKFLCNRLRKETGLYLSAGEGYGANGHCFIRMNVACPRARVEQAMELLKQGVESHLKQQC